MSPRKKTFLIYKLVSIENKPNRNLYTILDMLNDNEIEKVIIYLSNRIIIPVYFTKEQIQELKKIFF